MEIKDLKRKVDKLVAEEFHARTKVEELKGSLKSTRKEYRNTIKARIILQDVAQSVQKYVHKQVSEIVSKCLAAVFDDPYEFRINFVKKRGRTEANLVFKRNGVEIDPMTAAGGGVIDVASFALRLACLRLARPKVRQLLVLDEPFKHLHVSKKKRVRELLVRLAKDMDVQIILTTHSRLLVTGKEIEL